MYTHESKSTLARLLSTENIEVLQGEFKTAFFDVEKRILGLPIWADNGNDVRDLLTGHEVGHALFTPADGWHESTTDLGVPRSVINVIEDIRIEKLIQRRYPGLVRSFTQGYKKLFEMNLFETHDKEVNEYNLIDRINIKAKIGAFEEVEFSDNEMPIVKKAFDVETWEDVIEVCRLLVAYMEKQDEEQKEQIDQIAAEDDSDGNYEDSDSDSSDDGESDESEGNTSALGDSDDNDSSETEDKAGSTDYSDRSEIESETDKAFRRNEDKMVETMSDESPRNGTVFTEQQLNEKIITWEKYKESSWFDDGIPAHWVQRYEAFLKDQKPVINAMAREFEARKAAYQYSRAKVSKSGSLDTTKLHSYKFNEDLFQRVTQLADAKNHGMIMFIDASGSMHHVFDNVIKQVIILMEFCKKINIPFDIYTFTNLDVFRSTKPYDYQRGQIELSDYGLVHLNSSSFKKSTYIEASQHLFYRTCRRVSRYDGMGSTPLNETIIAAHYMIPKFKMKHRLDKVAAVFLTDGEASMMGFGQDNTYDNYRQFRHGDGVNLHVGKKKIHLRGHVSTKLLESLKESTGATIVGMHLASRAGDIKYFLYRRGVKAEVVNTSLRAFNRIGSVEVPNVAGFDSTFMINSHKKHMNAVTEEMNIDKDSSKSEIKRQFMKFSKSKRGKRSIMSNFAKVVA